jgi:hypothetical protein
MDFEGFNWAYFGMAISAVLFIVWLIVVVRSRPGIYAAVVSLAHLIVAGMGSAAPIRGYVDPDYVGFGLGFVRTGQGIDTALAAGGIWIACVAAAFIAARNRPGPSLWFVVLTSAFFTLNLGGAWLEGALTDPGANAIQFGEYLTIPGEVATGLIFLVFVVPFLMGVRLMPRRAAA